MKSQHYDIARKENENRLRWLESAEDLNRAKSRIEELTSLWPVEFQVLDQESHQVVAATANESQSTEESWRVRHSRKLRWSCESPSRHDAQ